LSALGASAGSSGCTRGISIQITHLSHLAIIRRRLTNLSVSLGAMY
jgi:hypothetical protein